MMDVDHNEAHECGERLYGARGTAWRFGRALNVHYFGADSYLNRTHISSKGILADPTNATMRPKTVLLAMRRYR